MLWIILPGLSAIALFFARRWSLAIHLAGFLIAVLLALLAWTLPIEEPISILPWPRFQATKIAESLTFLGRQLVLADSTRSLLVLIYSGLALWFGGAFAAGTNRVFIPLGLGIAAMLTAAVAVEPFLFSALIIEGIAIACVPLLSPPGTRVVNGVIRFLTFQTIGMAFILLGGSQLSVLEFNPGDAGLIWRATILLGFGFAFVLGIFPFHIWIPMVAEKTHPYSAAFVFLFLPATISLLGIRYLEQYVTLGIAQDVIMVLQFLGLLMCLTGGIWAAFQQQLGRILGYGSVFEIGMILLSLSLIPQLESINPQRGIIFAQLIPRALGFGIWALSLGILASITGDLRFRSIRGMGYHTPVASAGVLIGTLSIAGFPLLAGFPGNLALWLAISQTNPIVAYLSVLGNLGLFVAAIRTFFVLFAPSGDEKWQISESRTQLALLILGSVLLGILGILPQLYLPELTNIALILTSSGP
jgi:formate hydrogenlyase subunit 3/multisubunit Na+/H+ antiporter MnhD subunit